MTMLRPEKEMGQLSVITTGGTCSPNPGPGGWAYVVYQDGTEIDHHFGGSAETTNSQMELEALAMALNWVFIRRQGRTKGPGVQIFTTSEYAMGVAAKTMRAEKNKDIIDCIHTLLEQLPRVTIEWRRGHVGEPGNERADELAEMGRLSVITGAAA